MMFCFQLQRFLDIFQIKTNMKKSSSLQMMKIQFNPKEFKIGQSKIDLLPSRIEAKRHSATNIRSNTNTEPYQLELLRRENAVLRRQNEQLKRQNQEFKSKTSHLLVIKTQQKTNKYRDLIRQKFDSKTKNSRVTTDCETGFFSSKENSLDKSQMTINEWYESYKFSKQLPTLEDLYKISDKFFMDYCENYSQLKVLFESLQGNKQSQKYIKLNQIISLYKVPLQYQKSPQTLFREISKSKDKPKMVKNKEKEEVCWEVLSPLETIQRFERLITKMSKSQQMIKHLRNNNEVLKFISKIQNSKS